MKKTPLKSAVSDHFDNIELSAQQLDSLMLLQAKHRKKRWSLSHTSSMVASLLLVTIALFWAYPRYLANIEDRVAFEVVNNHFNRKPMEVQSHDIKSIQAFFTQLDFTPINSSLLAASNYLLEGGRYCSIQGVSAAQLRVTHVKTGVSETLYQGVYDPVKYQHFPKLEEGQPPLDVYAKGVHVKLWVEKGILFAMTSQAHIDL